MWTDGEKIPQGHFSVSLNLTSPLGDSETLHLEGRSVRHLGMELTNLAGCGPGGAGESTVSPGYS